MNTALSILLVIIVFLLWRRIRRLEKNVERLSMRPGPSAAPAVTPQAGSRAAAPASAPATQAPPPTEVKAATLASSAQAVKAAAPSRRVRIFGALERQLAENWTGIMGAVITVIGAGFLGVYAALRMAPVYRFILLVIFAGALYATSLFLRSKPSWARAASWVRSTSGAILLFASLGAGSIPGIKWIDGGVYAMALLAAGIAVNIYLGFSGGAQVFASLHAVLSLCALGVAPQSLLTLMIAGIVVLAGVAVTFRVRWEYHLLVTIAGFLAYHLYWFFSMDYNTVPLPPQVRFAGIAATAVIGAAACLVHYRAVYRSPGFEPLPFIAHLSNWLFLAAGFLIYSTGSKWNTIILGAAAVIAFILSRRARTIGIGWLHATDSMVSLCFSLYALYTLYRWELDAAFISALIYTQVLVYLYIMLRERERLLARIGIYLHYLSALAFMAIIIDPVDTADASLIVKNTSMITVVLLLEIFFHKISTGGMGMELDTISFRSNSNDRPVSIGGILIALLVFTLYAYLQRYAWSACALAAAAAFIIFLRWRWKSRGLWPGIVFMLAGLHIMGIYHIADSLKGQALESALYGLPILFADYAAVMFADSKPGKGFLTRTGIYLFAAQLAYLCYAVTAGISPFVPGLLWLMLSAVYLEASLRLSVRRHAGHSRSSSPRFLYPAGCIFVALFIARHLLVHLQSEAYLGPVKVRLLIELFAILVLFYWASAKLPKDAAAFEEPGRRLHPSFWETFIIFCVLTVAMELPTEWHPVAWAASGILLFAAAMKIPGTLSRFRFYSLILFWASAFHIAFISTTGATPSNRLLDQSWAGGLAGLAVQLCYILLFYRNEGLGGTTFPFSLPRTEMLVNRVQQRRNLFIYYPFFAAVALFLYWSFDRSMLTLLWVIESFAIFVLSLALRDSHFRYLSMATLSACLIRLVFYDLSRSPTLTRALVFIGVGLIMLLMNVLYTRYRDRY
jgi:hypothetical protein